MSTRRSIAGLLVLGLLATVALPAPVTQLEHLEDQALQHAIAVLTDPALAPPAERNSLQEWSRELPGFGWYELGLFNQSGYEARFFPHLSFVQTRGRLTNHNQTYAVYAIDRRSGVARRIEWIDPHDGLRQDEALFLKLIREAGIALRVESDVAPFATWAQQIISSPSAMFGVCGNSNFGTRTEKVEDGWTFTTTVDGAPSVAWKISCDVEGRITAIDRNFRKLPKGLTHAQITSLHKAELKRREDARAWWIREAKQADFAALAAKADLIGVAHDFTPYDGTQGMYRHFTFRDGGVLFGDRLGNYYGDSYGAVVQFPAVMERRFDVKHDDRWIVFLVARTDQGIHRDYGKLRFAPAYDPAGDHAVLRCTDELLATVKKVAAAKPADPRRNAAVRAAANAESVRSAEARTHML